jgi:hypothetical protein
MKTIRKNALAAILVIAGIASLAFAQGPVNKRVNYTISAPYTLRMGDYLLPPGKYVLYQISRFDTDLFALYRNDMTDSPIAMIRTTRIDYHDNKYPSKTKMLLDIDESSGDLHPVLKGWTIPGDDGWEIISVVAKDHGVMTRAK